MNYQCGGCMPQGCHCNAHGCGGGQMQHRCQNTCSSHSHGGCQSRCNSHGGCQSSCSSHSHGGCQSRGSSHSHGGCQSKCSSHSSSSQSSFGSQSGQLMPLGNPMFGHLLQSESNAIREQFTASYSKREYVLGSDGRMKAVDYSHSRTMKIRGFGEDSDDDN